MVISTRRVEDEESAQIEIRVSDNGPGIPESYQTKIFTKFSQADSSDTRKRGGTGLGLSISKSILENMGGEITFNSVAEEGTTFYFTIPVVQEAEEVV